MRITFRTSNFCCSSLITDVLRAAFWSSKRTVATVKIAIMRIAIAFVILFYVAIVLPLMLDSIIRRRDCGSAIGPSSDHIVWRDLLLTMIILVI